MKFEQPNGPVTSLLDPTLPEINFVCNQDVARGRAGIGDRWQWSIYAEREIDDDSARVALRLNGRQMCDLTVHRNQADRLADEILCISAALIWSAIRAARHIKAIDA